MIGLYRVESDGTIRIGSHGVQQTSNNRHHGDELK
jgi:hypothetical protein